MEFMDKGSLIDIYKKISPIDIEIVGKVAVLEGLSYLYDVNRIIHWGKYILFIIFFFKHLSHDGNFVQFWNIYVHI